MHLKNILAIVAVSMCIVVSGCKKDDEGTVKITFNGVYGSDPLVMMENHDYANGQKLFLSKAEFFVSDLSLIDDSGSEQKLSDIELVDLSMTSQADATQGITFTFRDIPAKTYDDMRIGIGVPGDINATTPSSHSSSSPLSNTGRYWVPWTSYIFSKTEGKLDTLVDANINPDLGFAYHTGTDNLYAALSLSNSVPVPNDGEVEIIFILDYAKLLGLPGNPLDIKAKPQNHNPQDTVYLHAIVQNIQTALTYSIE
jgi:hypothetical protein